MTGTFQGPKGGQCDWSRVSRGEEEAMRPVRTLQATVRTLAFPKRDGKPCKVRAEERWVDWLGRGRDGTQQGRALKTSVKVLAFTLKTMRHQCKFWGLFSQFLSFFLL